MRPTFLAFQTASRALEASRANIDVTGNNIANVNTDGYSRQRVDLSSISSGGFTQKYAVKGSAVGLGVSISNISQIRDPFLDARFRNENAESGKYDTLLSGLSDLERVFDEIDTQGLQSELSNFINQLQTLSQTPTSNDISLIVRTAAQKVAQIINVYSKQVSEVREQQIYDLTNVVINNDFNTKVKNIASLNTQIREELTHGNTPNELFDKRNSLIDELSNIANIKVTTTPERISEDMTIENLSISLYDANSGRSIGIVQNGLYNTLNVNQGSTSDSLKIEVISCFDAPEDTDITSSFSGGTIKGYLDLINGNGTYATLGENDFRGTLYYKKSMDTFAANFAYVLNSVNGDGDGDIKKLFTDTAGGTQITAANIRISSNWLNDPSYLTTTTVDPPTGEPDNVLRMISALNSDVSFVRNPYGTGTGSDASVMFRGTFSEYMSGTIGELALDIDLNHNFAETSNNVLSSLYNSREAISGVSLDEEGINLMAYQKSYNAAARYFTALDEAVDTIINRMGIVGR